jgi:hypothetical protein
VIKKRISIAELLMLALAFNVITAGLVVPAAHASVFSTGDYNAWQQREQRVERINAFLSTEHVQAQLISLGVDPVVAQERVASLTAAELTVLEQRINELPAGGNDVLVVLGIVFVVLIILEALNITNIFSAR